MYKITISSGTTERILHEPDTLSRNRLSSGKFSEEVNQIPSFSFTIPVSNPCYTDELNDRKDTVTIVNTITGETEFEGVLLTHSGSMSSGGKLEKSAVCEGFLGYLCDSIQPYHHYENHTIVEFLTAVLDRHNALMPEKKRIYLGSCDFSGDNTNSKTTAYRSTLEEIRINLIERVGGEMRIRKADGKLVLDFLTKCGTKSDTRIELAKNMKSLEVKTDSTNIITRLIPLGCQLDNGETAERLDITSVNDGKMYIDDEAAIEKYGIIVGTAEFDNITLPENLLTAGRKYLENNNRIRKAYEAQVLDLSLIDSGYESIRCGNTYPFFNDFMGLDEELRVMKRTVDIYKPYSPAVEIGDKAERITDVSVRTAHLIEYELPQQKIDILASAKATATALINAGINGYVVVNPNEILIMDTPDKATATKVWRWNSGGFGYSSTGYDGEYGTAVTMDGAIVADFITAGVLRGLEIINGDGTFHVSSDGSVTASAINITGGSINISTDESSANVIQLSSSGYKSFISAGAFTARNEYTKCTSVYKGNGIEMYSDFTDIQNSLAVSVSASTGDIDTQGKITAQGDIDTQGKIAANGNISGQEIYGNDIHFRLEESEGTYSLCAFINNFRERLSALENIDKTVVSDDVRFKRNDGGLYSLRDQIDQIHAYIDDLYSKIGGSS